MSYFTHEFTGELSRHGVGRDRVVMYTVLFLPPDLEAELPFAEFPRLRVEGEVADVPVRGAWMPTGDGRRYFIVSPMVRRTADIKIGDLVEMRFRVDDQDHVDVPEALDQAIKTDAEASGLWDELTAGKKRMFAFHVASAKTAATQAKRVQEALEALRLGCSLRDLKRRKS